MIKIDWEELQKRGENGMLTADETDALIAMTRAAFECLPGNVSPIADWCPWCLSDEHVEDCPIEALED